MWLYSVRVLGVSVYNLSQQHPICLGWPLLLQPPMEYADRQTGLVSLKGWSVS